MSEYTDKFKNKAKVQFDACVCVDENCPFNWNAVLCASPIELSDTEIKMSSHVCLTSLKGLK